MTVGVVVAARTGSARLPGKVLMPLMGEPLVLFVLRRLAVSRRADDIILATTTLPGDDALADVVQRAGFSVYRGAEQDVLGRYVEAARGKQFDYVVRVTADCPMVSGATLDAVLEQCGQLHPFDLATTKPAYPRGIDYEVYAAPVLEAVHGLPDVTAEDREHIMNYLYRNEDRYRLHRLLPPPSLQIDGEFLIDTLPDYRRFEALLDGATSIHIPVQDIAARERHADRLLQTSR